MALEIAAGKSAPAIFFVFDWYHDFRARVFHFGVNSLRVRHDKVDALRLRHADFIRLLDETSPLVVTHGTQHDHSVPKAQLTPLPSSGTTRFFSKPNTRHSHSIALVASRKRRVGMTVAGIDGEVTDILRPFKSPL